MRKIIPIIVSFLPLVCLADTTTAITPTGNYVITQTPGTTYVVGPNTGTVPIAVTAGSQPQTYITPTGTYLAIPSGTGITVIQTSGCCR